MLLSNVPEIELLLASTYVAWYCFTFATECTHDIGYQTANGCSAVHPSLLVAGSLLYKQGDTAANDDMEYCSLYCTEQVELAAD